MVKTRHSVKVSNMSSDMKATVRKFAENVCHDPGMVDYECKITKNAFLTDDGRLVTFEQPGIQKSFWFGYSDCGQGLSYEDNNERFDKVTANKLRYFYMVNLKNMFVVLRKINPNDSFNHAYICNKYYEGKMAFVKIISDWDFDEKYINDKNLDARRMTNDEIKIYNDMIKNECRRYVKRLNSYCKRYGDSKLNFNTYWCDR